MPVQRVTWSELRQHVLEDDPLRRIRYLVLHHTWRPTAAQYKGLETVQAIRNYHVRVNGWRDIGYNCLVAPDGAIYIGRLLRSGGGAHCIPRNYDSVGLAMIVNGDDPREVEENEAMIELAAEVAALYADRFDIAPGHLVYHSDYSEKSCPGRAFWKHERWRAAVVEKLRVVRDEPSRWAAPAWKWATDAGLVDGTAPRAPMTREQVAVVLQRYDAMVRERQRKPRAG